jgi:acylphosphatase
MREDKPIQMHLIFEGRVQGVGFRYTAYNYAQELGLRGTVCNLPDGNVELFIQGPKATLERFEQQLLTTFKGSSVATLDYHSSPPTHYSDFTIL